MAKRMLDCYTSDFQKFTKEDLLESILKSEGRIIACETIGTLQPMLGNLTNAEFVAAMGADILLLNMFDVINPVVNGLPETEPENTVALIKKLTGRPVGINLEPVEEGEEGETDPMWKMSPGRRATVENAKRAAAMGVDMILLTGNPGMGVSNPAIIETLKRYKEAVGDQVVLAAGKMHAAGILSEAAENIMTEDDVASFVEAGADIILLPAPGTVPGITVEYAKKLVTCAHKLGAMTITAIGTSQEGADTDTMKRLALMCKMTGTDIHHLGDAGYGGMSLPENIFAYSVAVRGIRHTYHRMAASVRR
ncbi:MAG: haloacid dehalogenase-like hydrolase [Lachnospiraceae bacterium]|nr:haloacid dehalogenase-like hydrolase [Lachnospiraceae bacterium]